MTKYFFYSALVSENKNIYIHSGYQKSNDGLFDIERAYFNDGDIDDESLETNKNAYTEVSVISFQEVSKEQYDLLENKISNIDFSFNIC